MGYHVESRRWREAGRADSNSDTCWRLLCAGAIPASREMLPLWRCGSRSCPSCCKMGSGASAHESATAAVAAGVSEADIAAHLASLEKKPVTVFYNPGSSNSLSCAIMGSSIGCAGSSHPADGRAKSGAFVAVNPYGQVPGMTDGSLNLGESTAILRYLAQQYKPSLYPGSIAERARSDMAIAQFKVITVITCRGTLVKIRATARRRLVLRPGRPLWNPNVALPQGPACGQCGLRRSRSISGRACTSRARLSAATR